MVDSDKGTTVKFCSVMRGLDSQPGSPGDQTTTPSWGNECRKQEIAQTKNRRDVARRHIFCRVFESDMDRLHVLSFLLTGNHAMAGKYFVQGLEDAVKGNTVFREWAQSWARRTVIQNAIQMIRPRIADISSPRSASREIADGARLHPVDFTAILELASFALGVV
jgi:hypothetical protein